MRIFSSVASSSYILQFIAGQMSFCALDARYVVVSISSAMPCANFAIIFAVAGATTKISALFASDMWLISNSLTGSNGLVTTADLDNVWKVKGVTNSWA